MADPPDEPGFEDVGALFGSSPSLEAYRSIYSQVLTAHDNRCALTGETDPHLEVVAIRPRENGGPLHVGNFLPLCPQAARAFRLDHFVVADDYTITVDRTVADPALAMRIEPESRLRLPKDSLYWPDRRQLAWRRAAVLGNLPR